MLWDTASYTRTMRDTLKLLRNELMTQLTQQTRFWFVLAVLFFASLWVPRITSAQISLKLLGEKAQSLASPVTQERLAAEDWLSENEDDSYRELIRSLREGETATLILAADTVSVFISPWKRAMKQGDTHKGQINLFLPVRPVTRPVDHPRADELREAILIALNRLVGVRPMPELDKNDEESRLIEFPGYDRQEAIRALCSCLVEVADDSTMEQLADLLEKEPNRHLGWQLMETMRMVYGLPQRYGPGGICGNSSEEEFRQFDLAETARYNEARAHQLKWHDTHKDMPDEQKLGAILDEWDELLATSHQYAYFTDSGEWTTERLYESLIRLGDDAAEAIKERAEQAAAKEYWHRGAYEIAHATITGEVNEYFVSKMLEGAYFEKLVACEIIAAAGSKDYKDVLAEMVQSNEANMKASYVLAVIYRLEAIPILEKAHSSDFVASCSIAELRAWGE